MTKIEHRPGVGFREPLDMNSLQPVPNTFVGRTESTLLLPQSPEVERYASFIERGIPLMDRLIVKEGIFASLDPLFKHFFSRDQVFEIDAIRRTNELLNLTKSLPGLRNVFEPLYEKSKASFFSFVMRTVIDYGDFVHEEDPFTDSPNIDKTSDFFARVNGRYINRDSVDAAPLILGQVPPDPIALVEVQAEAWQTLREWAEIHPDSQFRRELRMHADRLKRAFNSAFLTRDEKGFFFAQGIDGKGRQIKNQTINVGLCLWADFNEESIIDDKFIPDVISRLLDPAFFDEHAGIRTFERGQFEGYTGAYHRENDDQWPYATSATGVGIATFGQVEGANNVRKGNVLLLEYLKNFSETGVHDTEEHKRYNGGNGGAKHNGCYRPYSEDGKVRACQWQGWNIAWGVHDAVVLADESLKQAA